MSSSGHPSKLGPRAAFSRSTQHPNSVFSQASHIQTCITFGRKLCGILHFILVYDKTYLLATLKAALLMRSLRKSPFVWTTTKWSIFARLVFITSLSIWSRSWSFSVRTTTKSMKTYFDANCRKNGQDCLTMFGHMLMVDILQIFVPERQWRHLGSNRIGYRRKSNIEDILHQRVP